ncbi:hypothetical protein [Zoogloea sp. 1C4]|uniref:hypothetical protein n=1 Tax=Zoogloea sp. 1C4 TaxID=2570190 RepID=UPI0012926869|nr:hypothetical protein [Zoogloea sp. 1C4]
MPGTPPAFIPKNPQPDARTRQKNGEMFQVWMKSRQLVPGPSQPDPRAGRLDSAALQLFPEKRQLESASQIINCSKQLKNCCAGPGLRKKSD